MDPLDGHKEPLVESKSIYAHRPRSRDCVLLLGPDSQMQHALARELQSLRMTTFHANSLSDALQDIDSIPAATSLLLMPEELIDPERFEAERTELQIGLGSSRLVPIAIGRSPDVARRLALREAGVHLALFGRFGRHALRFQLNRARSSFFNRDPRGESRAPMEWRTRTYSSGREKEVRCYSLSKRGAYFVTPRPWVVGTEIAIDLPLARRERPVRGRVLYTKAASDVDRPGLPGGMAVTFDTLSTQLEHAIERDLNASRFGLEV